MRWLAGIILGTAAAFAAVWFYFASDIAFGHGERLLNEHYFAIADTVFAIDRTVARVRIGGAPMQLGQFFKSRAEHMFYGALVTEHRQSADAYFDAAVASLSAVTGPTERDVMDALIDAAGALQTQYSSGPIPKAEVMLRRALSIRHGLLAADDELTLMLECDLAELLLRHFAADAQPALLFEAKALVDDARRREIPSSVRTLEACGDIAAALKNWTEAEACYKDAYETWLRFPMKGYGISTATKLAAVLRAEGKLREADELDKNIRETIRQLPPLALAPSR